MAGTDLPKISEDDVELAAQAIWDETRKGFGHISDLPERPTRPCYSDARAVLEALVASGYRRVSGRRADGEPLPPTCCGGWIGEHGEGPILCDPCPPLPVADLPKISEDAVELLARQAWRRRHSITWESGADEDREAFLTAARLDLAALVASGYRREVDVLREAAPGLVDRAADAARRMAGDDSNSAAIMASIVTGAVWQALRCTCSDHTDEGAVYIEDLTCPMHGSIPATALEQAQPLPVADGREVDVRITPAVSRTFAAPVTFYEPDEPVADVRAAFEMGEKGVTKRSAGAPQCTCPLIDTSSAPMNPEFVRGDPAGCKVHGQKRDAEIEAAKRRARG